MGLVLVVSTTVLAQSADLTIAATDSPDPVVAGSALSYNLQVSNNGPNPADAVVIDTTLPPGVTLSATTGCAEDPSGSPICSVGTVAADPVFRVREYTIDAGSFTGLSFDLALAQDLQPDYFVIIQGSAVFIASDTAPDADYTRLIGDPFATGDLELTPAATLRLRRGAQSSDWAGVVTVVECLSDCAGDGFQLLTVDDLLHGDGLSSGTTPASSSWPDLDRVLLMGGGNGAGCESTDANAANHPVCHARLFPTGTDTINWTRDPTSSSLSEATSTVMVVEWGSEWTVQRVRVTGSNGGNGVDAIGEYNTAAIATTPRDSTWLWATGHTDSSGVGSCAEGVVYTLGNGSTQTTVENQVAVATEHAGISIDYEVWLMSHPSLLVDYRKKPDGDSGALTVDVPVDSSADGTRFALSSNGLANTNNSHPRSMLSARYLTETTVRLERQRDGANFPAWVQGIDFGAIGSALADVALQVFVNPDTTGSISFSPSVSSDTPDPIPGNNSATETTIVNSAADLQIAVDADPDPVMAGNPVVFTGVVDNVGPSLVTGTEVSVVLHSSLTPLFTTGCLEDPNGFPTCTLGAIGPGAQGLYQLTVGTDDLGHGILDASFSVTSTTPDPTLLNNHTVAGVAMTEEIEAGPGDQPALSGNPAAGRFAVAWRSDALTKGAAAAGIVARLFDSRGDPLTDALRVSSSEGSSQGESDVAYLATGDLVVVWQSDGPDGDDFGVFGRLLDSAGMPVGVELQLNTASSGAQTRPVVDAGGNGNFVAAWSDETFAGHYAHSGRIFNSAGMPVGVEFSFGAASATATPPDVGVRTAGDFVAVWTDSGGNVMRRLFNSEGMPVGVELQISTETFGSASRPVVDAGADGGFMVVWEQDSDTVSGIDINARRLDGNGMPVGVELQVNTNTAADQTRPSLSISQAGEFVVAWEGDDADGRGIFLKRFNAHGMPVGVELEVNLTNGGDQGAPDLSHVSPDTYYVAWESEDTDGDLTDEVIVGRPMFLFQDGFESGEVNEWDSVN